MQTATDYIQEVFDTIFGDKSRYRLPNLQHDVTYTLAGKKYTTEENIDFSWYDPYRDDVMDILSSIMWIFYFLRLVKTIPSIISGGSEAITTVETAKDENMKAYNRSMQRKNRNTEKRG